MFNFTLFAMRLLKILLFTIVCCAPGIANAQENDALAAKAARETCTCMNAFFNELHPKLVQLMHEMYDLGEQQAQLNFENFLATTATEDDNARIATDIDRMNNANAEIANYCSEVLTRYEKQQEDAAFNNKMFEALEKLEDCGLVLKMMRLGQ